MKIDSAHYIKDYEGKCKNLHGHTFKIVVLEKFNKLNKINIAKDFGELPSSQGVMEFMKEVVEKLDHKLLNEELKEENLTSEFLSRWLYERAKKIIGGEFAILVQEGDGGICVYDGKSWWLGKV